MANNYQNFQFNPQGSSQFAQSTNNLLNQPILQNQINQPYPGQIVFPQPVGNVYNLNSANDIGNVPFGGNVSVGLCLSENIIYIKSLQNGTPMILSYKLSPLENLNTNQTVQNSDNRLEELIATLNENIKKIDLLEKQVAKIKEKIGGKTEWQI